MIYYKDNFFLNFVMSKKGISYEKFIDLFNTSQYNNIYTNNNSILNDLNFIPKNQSKGGVIPDLEFIDPSDASIKQFPLSKKAPKWRIISEGLNIFGICENPECEAHKKEVIFRTLKDSTLPEEGLVFNMVENRVNIRCPICNKIFDPITCGFYNCEYQFIGTKKVNFDTEDYDSKTKEAKGNKLEYFVASKEKQAKWYELKIFVLPIQDIKYESQ